MKQELKPCPFCGGANVRVERADITACLVMCNDCVTHGPTSCTENNEQSILEEENDKYPGYYAAIRLWNARTADKQTLEVMELMAAADDYTDRLFRGLAIGAARAEYDRARSKVLTAYEEFKATRERDNGQ